eukprot:Skav202539  [mRNA]  locus=scaffold2011:226988:229472:- [translate_table: standard]
MAAASAAHWEGFGEAFGVATELLELLELGASWSTRAQGVAPAVQLAARGLRELPRFALPLSLSPRRLRRLRQLRAVALEDSVDLPGSTGSHREETMMDVFASYGDLVNGAGGRWSLEELPWERFTEEDDIDGAVSYARFRVDAIPARQGGTDLFRSYAPVAFRLRHRSFQVDNGKAGAALDLALDFLTLSMAWESSGTWGESMIDVVRYVQHLTVAPGPVPELPLAATASNSTLPDSA